MLLLFLLIAVLGFGYFYRSDEAYPYRTVTYPYGILIAILVVIVLLRAGVLSVT